MSFSLYSRNTTTLSLDAGESMRNNKGRWYKDRAVAALRELDRWTPRLVLIEKMNTMPVYNEGRLVNRLPKYAVSRRDNLAHRIASDPRITIVSDSGTRLFGLSEWEEPT